MSANKVTIAPPLDLVREWQRRANHNEAMFPQVASLAAQWGADQELEACCEALNEINPDKYWSQRLRVARRPNPPSLKEQALTALHAVATGANDTREQHQDLETIRQALEALPND